MITIRDLAARHGITLRALRFYEDRGLINPTREGRTRLYSDQDAARVAMILTATSLGFTLAETAALIREGAVGPLLVIAPEVARAQLTLMRERLAETQAAIDALCVLAQRSAA